MKVLEPARWLKYFDLDEYIFERPILQNGRRVACPIFLKKGLMPAEKTFQRSSSHQYWVYSRILTDRQTNLMFFLKDKYFGCPPLA